MECSASCNVRLAVLSCCRWWGLASARQTVPLIPPLLITLSHSCESPVVIVSLCSVCPGGSNSCLLFCATHIRSSRSVENFTEQLILKDVVSDIVFSTTIENAGPDTAYNVLLEFTHPAALVYSRVDSGGQFTCTSDQSATVTTCNVVSVLGNGTRVSLVLLH